MTFTKKTTISYKDSGVDIDGAAKLVEQIGKFAATIGSTKSQGVVDGIGGFASLYEVPKGDFTNPVIATATDGVGSKLEFAKDEDDYHCLGIDLVAMCVNDLICCGAAPHLFLDYYATGVLDEQQAAAVIRGICDGCKESDCVLAGGETAEMPGLYPPGKFDLAGFAVGLVEKDAIIGPQKLVAAEPSGQDLNIIGIRSSGVHANGFSLVRKLLATQRLELDAKFLMRPTKIYVRSLLKIIDKLNVLGAAHITGGGLTDNLPRVFPEGFTAKIDKQAIFGWIRESKEECAVIFKKLQEASGMEDEDMLRTFNCGIGMAVIHPQAQTAEMIELLRQEGEDAVLIGLLERSQAGDARVVYV